MELGKPDFQVMDTVLRRAGIPERVPLYEHFVDVEVIEAIMGCPLRGQADYWPKLIQFYSQIGYDYVPIEMRPRFPPARSYTG